MAGTKTTMDWRQLRRAFQSLRKRLENPAKHTLKGARNARKFLGHWVDSSGEGTWKPLSSYTMQRRKEKAGYYRKYRGSGGKALRWHRGIRRSLAKKSGDGHIERVTSKDTIVFGSDYTVTDTSGKKTRKVQVIRIHHWGKGRNPKRVLIPTKKIKKFFVAEARAMAQLQKGFTRFK